MVHVIFDTSALGYDDYVQTGGGALGEITDDYFKGSPPFQRGYGLQKGAGIGDIFRGLWRFFLPIIRRAGTEVSKEALNTGQRILEKVNEGTPLKDAFVSEGKKGVDTVLEKGGMPKQFGSGRYIKGKRKKPMVFNHQTLIGRAVNKPLLQSKKRLRSDAFGLY